MNYKLAIALHEKKVIGEGTEVEALHKAIGLGNINSVFVPGEFSISKIHVKEDNVYFDLLTLRDGSLVRVPAENVLTIDGMDPVRYASVYNIKADGTSAKQGKRRGRKPKNRSLEEDGGDIEF